MLFISFPIMTIQFLLNNQIDTTYIVYLHWKEKKKDTLFIQNLFLTDKYKICSQARHWYDKTSYSS